MARSPATSDAFNAVAEPRRRQILDLLAGGERPVNDEVREGLDKGWDNRLQRIRKIAERRKAERRKEKRRYLERRLAELKKRSERCRIGDQPID
jgi:hypothetical protein